MHSCLVRKQDQDMQSYLVQLKQDQDMHSCLVRKQDQDMHSCLVQPKGFSYNRHIHYQVSRLGLYFLTLS